MDDVKPIITVSGGNKPCRNLEKKGLRRARLILPSVATSRKSGESSPALVTTEGLRLGRFSVQT